MFEKFEMRKISLIFSVLVVTLTSLSSCAKSKHKIGDMYKGGYIFYINIWGKGICAAPKDYKNPVIWGCGGKLIEGADGEKRGTGKQNTQDILAGCDQPLTAAKICDDYVYDNYDDWYLPSIEELELMYFQLKAQDLGSFNDNTYWSSTQDFSYGAWCVDFSTGDRVNNRSKSDLGSSFSQGVFVRPVRSF